MRIPRICMHYAMCYFLLKCKLDLRNSIHKNICDVGDVAEFLNTTDCMHRDDKKLAKIIYENDSTVKLNIIIIPSI